MTLLPEGCSICLSPLAHEYVHESEPRPMCHECAKAAGASFFVPDHPDEAECGRCDGATVREAWCASRRKGPCTCPDPEVVVPEQADVELAAKLSRLAEAARDLHMALPKGDPMIAEALEWSCAAHARLSDMRVGRPTAREMGKVRSR